jgi:hypothetical protein
MPMESDRGVRPGLLHSPFQFIAELPWVLPTGAFEPTWKRRCVSRTALYDPVDLAQMPGLVSLDRIEPHEIPALIRVGNDSVVLRHRRAVATALTNAFR